MNVRDAQSSNRITAEEERRRAQRYTVQVQIEIQKDSSSAPVRLATTDLSRGGCYVQMPEQFPVGVRVRAILWLDSCPVVVHGLVITRHPDFGNGIMFMEFEGEGERVLIRYVEAIATSA
jgi:PilZ domain